jgi:hypothetical protein
LTPAQHEEVEVGFSEGYGFFFKFQFNLMINLKQLGINVLSFYKNAYLKRAQKGATLRRKWAFFSEELSYGKAQMVLAVVLLRSTRR